MERQVVVRERQDTDVDACGDLLRITHHQDGYPARLPDDPCDFIRSRDAIGAWVATCGDEVVGHVALRRSSSRPVMALAAERTGLPASDYGVVGRLVVAPAVRGHGVGRRLLSTAASQARARGLRPLLDVNAAQAAAVSLYERAGWTRLGEVHVAFANGLHLDEFVYLGPES
ncbi:MAG: GNAT family N-acetyltransferase [Actinomycetota bacterium]|jgi:GNAT superfamily N-acetyltransferase|nr:GNAT family N-acetyltransferase [Actinomycetota bacterium]